MEVGAVVDQLDRDPVVLQESGDGAGGAVAERWHRVEEVGGDRGARVDGRDGLLVRGVGVADRRDHAVLGQKAYRVQAAGQLRGQREHLRLAPGRVEQCADLRGVRVAQEVLGVGALAAGGDERALEVDAGDLALLGEFAQQARAPGEEVHVTGDGGGEQGGRAVLAVRVDALEDVVDRPGGEGGSASAVVVEVDEAGDDVVAGDVDGLGVLRGRVADAGAVDDQLPVVDRFCGEDHCRTGQHRGLSGRRGVRGG